jgi:hypothetical protein
VPWSNKNFLNKKESFQFVIVSDRTGGMRPGIFKKAVEKINKLQPEFVVSVGDLIEGYTTDQDIINNQWDEFLGIIDKLQMRLFFVPGNHDISNAVLGEKWHKLFGSSYFHFSYKDVLFLCLNTEDPPGKGISPEQISYFHNVLKNNKEARWTFLFMHKPLWAYGDQQGYQVIDSLLQDRKYTVFSGHKHHYFKSVKDSSIYYTLATTGGRSQLRGADFGEIDHIVWVTMTPGQPIVTNITLDGILDDDIVDDTSELLVQKLRTGSWLQPQPNVISQDEFSEIHAELQFKNDVNKPLYVSGVLESKDNIFFSPESIKCTVDSFSVFNQTIAVKTAINTKISQLEPVKITLTGSYQLPSGKKITLEKSSELLFDWYHTCEMTQKEIVIDAQLDEWKQEKFLSCKYPQYVQKGWDWHGHKDGWFNFDVLYDTNNLYIAIAAKDDKIIRHEGKEPNIQDKFILMIDTEYERDKGLSGKNISQFEIFQSHVLFRKNKHTSHSNIKHAFNTSTGEIIIELAVPWEDILNNSDSLPKFFRVNLAWLDHDNPTSTRSSVLWWRSPWDSDKDYQDSGLFFLQRE